jgi:hypothetical protein
VGKESVAVVADASGLTLDAGALIALEAGSERMRALLRRALERELRISVPAGALAQAWRGGPRGARVARLLKDRARVEVVALTESEALAVGELAGRTGHADVVDVHVALCARRRRDWVATTDPEDIRKVDRSLRLVAL